MTLANTTTQYGRVAKTLHWLTALLILSLFPLGIIANDLPFDTSEQLARKAWLFSLHKTLGVSLFFVAVLRIIWAVTQPKPATLHPDRKVETTLAETVHWVLYCALVIVPLSGWIHHAATTGFAPIWWPLGQSLPLVPKSEIIAALAGGTHFVVTKVLLVSILLHVAGALKHHFVDRDLTLRRMLPRTPAPSTPVALPSHSTSRLPMGIAVVIWALAIGGGAGLGAYTSHTSGITAPALADVASEWQVQDGTVSITVAQFGSDVAGTFADWTAAITFDETASDREMGSIDATIAIGSLTLGSVTDQAMGADFFDAAAFPTARFQGDILSAGDGIYHAEGTLTIKGTSVPLTLPFSLRIDNDIAEMQGQITLDRLDFGIGANMPDESSLAFAVLVRIQLTAARG